MKRRNLFAVALAALLISTSALAEDAKARLAKAEAMFQERCKKAGEFIYRTAENVEGVFLLKIREQTSRGDQYRMDDPYGHDSSGEDYVKSFFLEPMLQANKYASHEVLEKIRRDYRGYGYVDALEPKDGKRYRYTGSIKEVTHISSILMGGDGKTTFKTKDFVLDRVPEPDLAPRYGVTYDDISTREERDYWIAGSSLKVIDLKTNEVMAERIGYMMDRSQGKPGYGGRGEAWLRAASYACPSFVPTGGRQPGFSYQGGQTRDFVKRILKPIQER